MKKYLFGLFIGVHCFAADVQQPHIAVTGTAETDAVPDELVWNLSVKTTGAEVAATAATHAAEVSAVLDFLKTQIELKDMATKRMRLSENWVYRDRNRVKEGHVASTTITFTSRDFSKYLDLWTGLSKCANTSIGGATFRVSNRREIEDALRVEAVADGRKKAAALAGAGGVMLYEPIVIEEISSGARGPVALAAASRSVASEPVETGTETIRASIRVYFRIGPKK